MYIKSVEIENIRSISKFKMEFERPAGWHVIIGDNGAGKSSTIRSIAATLIGPDQIAGILPIWSEWLREETEEGRIELEVLPDWNVDTIGRGQPSKKNTIINRFELKRGKEGYVALSTNSIDKKMPPSNYNWGLNEGWFSVAYGPFRRLTGGEEKRSKVYYAYPKAGAHLSCFGEEVALTEALDWLKELDRKRLKQKEDNELHSQSNEPQGVYRSKSEVLYENVKKFINSSGLLPHGATFDSIDIEGEVLFKDGNGNTIKVTQMSDGYRSILSLMFELIRQLEKTYSSEKVFENLIRENGDISISLPGVVLIDEIDAHLHPTWQTRIGQWFLKYFPNIQFIVTTHSPLVCRASEHGTIWRLAAPGSNVESGEIKGIDRDRLINGNILDAYGTEIFGEHVSISEEANAQIDRLAELNVKSMLGSIAEEEQAELIKLKTIFPTEKPL